MTLTANTGTGHRLGASRGGTPTTATHSHPPVIPSNVRVRGTNIAPAFASVSGPDAGSVWSAMWRVWDWNGRIKLQVDDAATIGNCVRMFGNTHVVTSGNITQATYLARWTQFLDYCVTKSLYVYPCGGDLGHWGSATTYTAATNLYSAWAELLSGYNNIIGVDITNEAWGDKSSYPLPYGQAEPYQGLLHHLGSVTRRHSGFPVTHSAGVYAENIWLFAENLDGPFWRLYDMSDFLDVHVYHESAIPSQPASLMGTPWGLDKQLIVGEFGGLSSEEVSATRAARYQDMRDLVVSSPNICGALAWTAWDLGTTTNTRSGLFDASRVLRTDISVPFATLPTTRSATPTLVYPSASTYPSPHLYLRSYV